MNGRRPAPRHEVPRGDLHGWRSHKSAGDDFVDREAKRETVRRRYAEYKKSPGNKGRVSGAEHVPNDMHPGLAPLREVEQGRTISKSSATIIDTSEIKRFTLCYFFVNSFWNHPAIFVCVW